jgi:hypothetical protein
MKQKQFEKMLITLCQSLIEKKGLLKTEKSLNEKTGKKQQENRPRN